MANKQTTPPSENALRPEQVTGSIVVIRGVQVILDDTITQMYGVETRRLNEQARRNSERFPKHFRFQLTESEWGALRFQSGTLEKEATLKSQSATLKQSGRGQHRKYLPYVFTEQGVAMLSAVLRSETAVQVSIRIMEAFVQMRRYFLQNAELFQKMDQVETRQLRHIADSDEKFNRIFNALDDKKLYHLGASLKDLGKQCFAFSRMDDFADELSQKLK